MPNVPNVDFRNENKEHGKRKQAATSACFCSSKYYKITLRQMINLGHYPDFDENRNNGNEIISLICQLSSNKFDMIDLPFLNMYVDSVEQNKHRLFVKRKFHSKSIIFHEASINPQQLVLQPFSVIGYNILIFIPQEHRILTFLPTSYEYK